ncbi:MAG: 50S ribosomal protein L25 [Alicyclobacillaceae bacterium]|nr:50S ribosomal protein L25 [Alicyclobacillaceae bacterium]
MEQIQLTGEVREGTQRSVLRALRRSGKIPAVLYGRGMEPVKLAVSEKELARRGLGHSFVKLTVDGRAYDVLVQHVQKDPLSGKILHIDFQTVDRERPVDIHLPVHVEGIEEVERRGLVVQQQTREVEVRALPKDTPEFLEVDIRHLEAGQHLTVADIPLPPGVQLRSDGDEVLVTVLAPRRGSDEPEETAAEA